MADTAAGRNREPKAYTKKIWRSIQEAEQQPPEEVLVQGHISKARSWMKLAEAQHCARNLGPHPRVGRPSTVHAPQNSGGPHPGPAQLDMEPHNYPARQNGPTLCTHSNLQASHSSNGGGQAGLDSHIEGQRIRLGAQHPLCGSDDRSRRPRNPTAQPSRPATERWTLYRLLAHARTLAEHSIQPYTGVMYVESMLQDWTK